MLATNGFGYSDTCISEGNLDTQINVFMNRTYLPLLSSLKLSPDNASVKINFQPNPIPDLSMGSPLMVVGTYQGTLEQVSLSGLRFGERRENIEIIMRRCTHVPVRQLVARHQMGVLVGEWWLNQSQNPDEAQKKQKQAVDIAIKTSTPCMFTAAIAYETVPRTDIITATVLPQGPPMHPQAIAVPITAAGAGANANPNPNPNPAFGPPLRAV